MSSVVTIQLGREVKLKFDITSKDTVHKGCAKRFVPRKAASAQYQRPDVVMDGEPEPKTYSRFLTFISQKCSFVSGKVSIGDEFKAEVRATWSTMGPYWSVVCFLPAPVVMLSYEINFNLLCLDFLSLVLMSVVWLRWKLQRESMMDDVWSANGRYPCSSSSSTIILLVSHHLVDGSYFNWMYRAPFGVLWSSFTFVYIFSSSGSWFVTPYLGLSPCFDWFSLVDVEIKYRRADFPFCELENVWI